ncbi:hypothetical protein IDSA_10010 [Pseudidiomarina salinarum]|uniref:Uncharacterized protein n=1 Tax=Pseudidiomarina salinarum TaxID=435908 RepID=A0A094ITF0_9GAMM|nr:hypothetical protein [Pseudidiomarina salinarum]KFZ30392.1 hypothetical protein IDSA_10010 [Pseudidiomarina salinarum]RUO68540.1 hypothetical protein CWI79_10710 [Pseudidiomarina salinarum]
MRTKLSVVAISVILSTALVSSLAMAQGKGKGKGAGAERNELRQQLEVMASIFNTTLRQERHNDRSLWRSAGKLDYSYLAGQGVVFRTRLAGGGRMIMGNAPMPPMPPMPDEPEIEIEILEGDSPDVHRVIRRVGEAIEDIYEVHIEESMGVTESVNFISADTFTEEQLEAIETLREEARETRELQRRVRDLEYAKRNAEGKGDKKVEKELKQAEEALAKNREKLDKAREKVQKVRKDVQLKAEVRRAERMEQRNQQIAQFEQTMAQTLCDYGNTLRALPGNESITLIIEGAGDPEVGRNSDKIHIFSKQAVTNCSGNNGPLDLLRNATTYSF